MEDVFSPVSQEEWKNVLDSNRHMFTTPEVAAQILAGLYHQYAPGWPQQHFTLRGNPGPEYIEREKAFALAAQAVLGVKVVANGDGVYLSCGRRGWRLASCRINEAPDVAIIQGQDNHIIQASVEIPMTW